MEQSIVPIRALSLGGIFSLLLFTTACQTVGTIEEVAVTAELPELASRPTFATGYRVSTITDGEQNTRILISQTDTTETWKNGSGCTYTTLKTGFSPSIEWSGCTGFADGTQRVALTEGQPYPLRVGNTWSYSLSGDNNRGSSWDGTRDCEVASTVRITTVSGTHDTFKVVCTEPWSTRTWYISAESEWPIRFVRNHAYRGTTVSEFVKVVSTGN